MTEKRVSPPVKPLPEETVTVDILGSVKICGLLLRDRLALASTQDGAFANVSRVLASTVRYEDGSQVYTAEEWELFGAEHIDVCLTLWDKAARIAKLISSDEPEKK